MPKAQFPFVQKIKFTIPAPEPVFTRAIQDSRDFIWLGSDDGLFRYDGISFLKFLSPVDSVDLHVTALCEGLDGSLWIGCRDGQIYRYSDGNILLFDPEEGTSAKTITDLVFTADSVLYWSTAGEGIYYYFNGRVYNINHDDGLNDDYVYDLEYDHDGNVWAGTDAGIVVCREDKGRKVVRRLEENINLPDIIVKSIKEDREGRLWLGFQDGGTGFLLPDRSGFISPDFDQGWPFGALNHIATLKDAVWIGAANGELLEIDSFGPRSRYLINQVAPEIKFNKINDILEDREGNAWILALSGLYRTTGTRLKFLNPDDNPAFRNIHAIHCNSVDPGKLWFSNDAGLFLLNLEDGSMKKYLSGFKEPDMKITCIYQDRKGLLWAGCFNYGVFRMSPDDGSWIRFTSRQGLVNDNVLAISGHVDSLWLATLGGATEMILDGSGSDMPLSFTTHDKDNGLVNNYIYSVFEDTHDQLWFATDGDGISVLTKSGWKSYQEKEGLDDDVIYSITEDQYENIWIASATKGIYKFKEGHFINFGLKEGLNSLNITGLVAEGEEVVIVHDDGINILNIITDRIIPYGEEVGLGGMKPDLNCISKDSFGNVWIGTRTGIIRYQPESGTGIFGPVTILDQMTVNLKPMAMKPGLVLAYDQNHVSFNYTGLWFSNPDKVAYQVYLEGYDMDWKDTYDRSAVYSNLPAGKYVLRVRSSLNRSFEKASEVSYSFRIRGPFWMSPWFIGLLIILSGMAVYLLTRYRERNLRKKEEEKKEKVEFEFQLLKNQVNPHFLFDSFSTLMSLIEEQPNQAMEFTEKLSDFFRIILQLKDEEVIPFSEELTLVENYFFLLKKRYGYNLNLSIDIKMNMKDTVVPPMTLQILIENAVKHNVISKDKPLNIRIYDDMMEIVVENNLQPKISNEISTGIGLDNIIRRFRMITDKEPVIERADAVFRVKLPVITSG